MAEIHSSGTTPLATDTIRVLEEKILAALNNSSGGSGAPMSIAYAGPPVDNPPALAPIVVDSNGEQWMFYAGAWH